MILINTIITEVHAGVPQLLMTRVVLDGGETDETLLINVDEEGVDAGDDDVQSQVALVTRHQ